MNSNIDRRIKSCKIQVTSIYQILQKNPDDWQPFLATARQTMATIDSTPSMIHRSNLSDQLWLIEGLQRLAYHEADSGGIRNIADWCLRHWLKVLSSHSDNVEALRGIGQNWLWRAQPCLARIHVEDGSVSSTNSADRISIASSYGEAEYERDINQAATEANACRHTADYVEARGILLPATEYFTRAVEAADLQKVLTGDLLSSAAEAYMSLGNVSYAVKNEPYFDKALGYLRKASELPEYTLPAHLQRYLADYGRVLD